MSRACIFQLAAVARGIRLGDGATNVVNCHTNAYGNYANYDNILYGHKKNYNIKSISKKKYRILRRLTTFAIKLFHFYKDNVYIGKRLKMGKRFVTVVFF